MNKNRVEIYISFPYENENLIPGEYTKGFAYSQSNILDPEKESKVVVNKYDGRILSGTFEMYFLDKFDNKKKYALTDGRFDIQLGN